MSGRKKNVILGQVTVVQLRVFRENTVNDWVFSEKNCKLAGIFKDINFECCGAPIPLSILQIGTTYEM